MMFSRGKAANRVQQICACHLLCLVDGLSTDQFGQHRSAHQSWRTTVRKIARCFDAVVFDD